MLLEGKTALVTGGSRGIGRAVALELARNGADIAVCARSEESTESMPGSIGETAREVEACGRRAVAIKMDVADDAQVRAGVGRALSELGRIDILVNNAAVKGGAQFVDGDLDQLLISLDLAYRTNVRAPVMLARLVAPGMAAAGAGVIINVSSEAARNIDAQSTAPPSPRRKFGATPIYGMSKAMLDRFSTGIAAELALKNIAVITICPGLTLTEQAERRLAAGLPIHPSIDLTIVQRPGVTAKAIAFLCRDPMANTGRIFFSREICDRAERS